MPSDLTVRHLAVSHPAATPPSAPAEPAPAATPAAAHAPNPSLRIDPKLGIVVIEFHASAGQAASSLPTERQLQAYRTRAETEPAPDPAATPSIVA